MIDRTRRALAVAGDVTALVVAGGVAANRAIRAALEALAGEHGLRFVAPPLALCTDNAAMIAWAGIERLLGRATRSTSRRGRAGRSIPMRSRCAARG